MATPARDAAAPPEDSDRRAAPAPASSRCGLGSSTPRNVRRARFAAAVSERARSRGDGLTPTPRPVSLDLDSGLPSSTAPNSTASRTRSPRSRKAPKRRVLVRYALATLATLLLAFVFFAPPGTARALHIELPSSDAVLAMFRENLAHASERASAADALVYDKPSAATARPILSHGESEASDAEPTDAIRRDGYVSIPGGILVLPTSFHPAADGSYDLLLHFHGNTAVVRESAEVVHLDAAVAIINLGIGSAPYEEYFVAPGTYEDLLASIDRGLARRGVKNPQLRRVALSAWSAGYGAISTILQMRRGTDMLDALLVFDGIHAGWEGGKLNPRQMKPFVDFAKLAASGKVYFGITHSNIDPIDYASTRETSSYLLDAVGAVRETRDPRRDGPPYLDLASMRGAVSKKLEKHMEPTSEARIGSFHVTGYRGNTKEHHMAHLFQMGATLLGELAARWQPGENP
ncbi:MAG: hypothetical protein U0271_20765 [Polyangiaceae bacterium]